MLIKILIKNFDAKGWGVVFPLCLAQGPNSARLPKLTWSKSNKQTNEKLSEQHGN